MEVPVNETGEPRLSRAKSRLAARTRELDLIQTLSRRAAEAQAPEELFAAAVAVLQRSEDLDAALVADSSAGALRLSVFLSRPLSDDCLDELARRAGSVLGWDPDALPALQTRELDAFDEGRGLRRRFTEEDLVLLPVLRKERAVACVLVLPSREVGEGQLRLLYSAGNQLSLHLDRILTAREAEADRFRTILDSMPQAVLLADDELRLLQSNPAARRLLDKQKPASAESLGEFVRRLGLSDAVEQVRGGGAACADVEVTLDEQVFLVTVSPLSAEPGSERLVLVITEVTERRRMQRRLAQSERMSSLGQMISGVAHELNNPLASILGYSQLIGVGSGDEQLTKRVDVLQTEARRCQRIVQNLLSFARQHEPERRPLSLNEVVRSVLALMGYQLKVNGIQVETELDAELPALTGDAHQLQQVLVNLLSNAQQAIRSQSESGAVAIRTRAGDDGAIVLEVIDSGPGIPEATRHKIFDPFFTTKPEGEGTGLGLSLSYGIVTGHGGSIEAPPSEGKGARFVITIPHAASPEAGAERRDEPARSPRVPAARILVVEDETALAGMICDVLAADGHRTQVARDGREALELLESESVDLIISDIKMPRLGGKGLFRELQRSHPALASRVLLTTGDTVGAETEQFVAGNGLPLLLKPFDVERLRRAVRERLVRTADE
jgi:two-component system NtrC family sensor kinase